MSSRHRKWRKAINTDGSTREWLPAERYSLLFKGFRHGAGITAFDPNLEDVKDYNDGFVAGQKARRATMAKFGKKVGYVPQILRTQETP